VKDDSLRNLIERVGDTVGAVNASYAPCLNPGVAIVDRRALDEMLAAIRSLCAHIGTGG